MPQETPDNAAAADDANSSAAADSLETPAAEPLPATDRVSALAAEYVKAAEAERAAQQASSSSDEVEDETTKESTEEAESDSPKDATESDEVSHATETDETDAAFDALEEKPATEVEYPDIEALKTEFPRQSKGLYEKAIQFAEAAKKGDEAIRAIGGENYVAPLGEIREGVETGDAQKIFEGIIQIGSIEAVQKVTASSMVLSLITSKEWLNDPELKDNAEVQATAQAMLDSGDRVLKARFGDEMNAETIDKLAKYANNGWLDALGRWIEQGYVDSDEFEDLTEVSEAPEQFKSLRQKNKELERQLAEATAAKEPVKEEKPAPKNEVISDAPEALISSVETQISDIFTRILENNVLAPNKSDTKEIKDAKEEFLATLKADALAEFRKAAVTPNEKETTLARDFNRGLSQTESYKKALVKAVNAAVISTKPKTAKYSGIVAKLYGKTRNGELGSTSTSTATPKTAAPPLQPTETTEVQTKPLTREEIRAGLVQNYRQRGV